MKLICLLAAVYPLVAQDQASVFDLSLDQLAMTEVSTASRTPERLTSAPATIHVVTAEDILRHGDRDLYDVLERIPGVTTINLDFFAFGGQRGLIGNFSQTLLLINGREMQNLIAAETFISDQFANHNVARIEIINGPGSVLYGANALVGVINIITKTADPNFDQIQVTLDGGTQQTRAAGVVAARRWGDLRLSLSARFYASDGWDYTDFVNDRELYADAFPDTAFPANDNPYHNRQTALPLSFQAQWRGLRLGFESYRLKSRKGLEHQSLDYDSALDERRFYNAWLGWSGQVGSWRLDMEYQHYRERFWGTNYRYVQDFFDDMTAQTGRDPNVLLNAAEIDVWFREFYSQQQSRSSRRDRFNFQADATFAGWDLILGVVHDRPDLLGVDVSLGQPTSDFDETVSDDNPLRRPFFKSHKSSLFVQGKRAFAKERLFLTLGGRLDDESRFGEVTTFRGGLVYHPQKQTWIKLLYGEGFREPTIFELSNLEPGGAGLNQNLNPAEIQTVELAVMQSLGDKGLAQLVLYESRVSESIIPITTFLFGNAAGSEYYRGAEAMLRIKGETWGGDLGLSWTDPEDRVVAGRVVDVLNVAELGGSAALWWRPTPTSRVNLSVLHAGAIDAEHGNGDIEAVIPIEAWTRLDLTGSVSGFKLGGVTLQGFVGVRNLMNHTYYQPDNRNGGPRQFLQPGRTLLLNTGISF